jgi:hypothetical protein
MSEGEEAVRKAFFRETGKTPEQEDLDSVMALVVVVALWVMAAVGGLIVYLW